MEDDRIHLDHALAEEFAGHAEAIHRLKGENAHFAKLLDRNRGLWDQIQKIQSGEAPAEDAALDALERERLVLLDEIAAMLRAADR